MRNAAFASIFLLTVAGCATEPSLRVAERRENYPATTLDNNRPLYILRSEIDNYRCAGDIKLMCEGSTGIHAMCTCRTY
jgi:hypothetical protein